MYSVSCPRHRRLLTGSFQEVNTLHCLPDARNADSSSLVTFATPLDRSWIAAFCAGSVSCWLNRVLVPFSTSLVAKPLGLRGGRPSLAIVLCILISSLSVLAYASPPDPSWVRGIYDDADFDDVICLIAANAGLIADTAWAKGCPDFALIWAHVLLDDTLVAPFSLGSSKSRAPPTL